ncbi:glycosyltransferase family 39 protein [Conexibacter woesei]|uniref:glycosyltransferase family 39 protein n=1 Tax=Conexibacter woesei TaxID=191495 RepID=UPI00047BB149|nr:glycosyltransferase family 39 protein [Conexibacter woesei]
MRRLPRFEARLLAIAALALFVRLLYTGLNRKYPVIGDALTFYKDAAHLANGEGFRRATENIPTAEHPPLHIVVLATIDKLGGYGTLAQKFVLCFVGTGTVVAIGYLARRVAGPRAGLIAAGIAAIYPLLWVIDGSLMSETEYALLITLTLLAAYGYLDRPSWKRAALLGGAITLCAYTRGEAVGLLVILVLPLAYRAQPTWGGRLKMVAVVFATFAVLLAPWQIRNFSTFKDPVWISDNGEGVWVGANCHGSYYGKLTGSWDYSCFGHRAAGDESQFSEDYRQRGIQYAKDHSGRIPYVMLIRLLREFDFYRPLQSAILMSTEGRSYEVAKWGIRAYWLLLPFSIAGAVLLRRRRDTLVILMAPVILGVAVAAVVYGSTRFRVIMEPVLVVLGGVAMDALWSWIAARRQARSPSASDAASSAPARATPTSVRAGISQSQSIAPWNA